MHESASTVSSPHARTVTRRRPFIYLSEMAVSDLHGGGVTAQRVLDRTLDRFSWFVHLSPFAKDFPAIGGLRDRTLDLRMWVETSAARSVLGCTICSKLCSLTSLKRLHARNLARALAARGIKPQSAHWLVCPQGDLSLYAMDRLSRGGRCSYVTWFMDDHLLRFDNGKWLYRAQHERLMRSHLAGARAVFVISPALAELYRDRFGVSCEVLFNPCDPAGAPVWERPNRGACRLAYFGRLWKWQEDSVAHLCDLTEQGLATLDVFSHQSTLPPALSRKGIRLVRPVPQERVVQELRGYDAALLPMSFLTQLRNLSEFNIATKLSEYLASGAVPLLVGPRYAAMIRYLEPHDAAVIVTEPTRSNLTAALEQVNDPARRRTVLQNARRLCETELSVKFMQKKWTDRVASLDSSRVRPGNPT